MSLSTSYIGRSVDLSLFKTVASSANTPVNLDFANPAQVISGVLKVVQRWLLLFLTRRGTVTTDTDRGTTFLTQLLQNQLQNDGDVMGAFNTAVQEIDNYMKEADLDIERPDDEMLSVVELLRGWSLTPDKLTLRIGFTTRSGLQQDVLVPVSVTIK